MKLRQSLCPVYIYTKIFCLCPYKYDKISSGYRRDIWAIFYNITICILSTWCLLQSADYQQFNRINQNLFAFTRICSLCVLVISQNIFILMNCANVNKFVKLFADLERIDEKLEKLQGSINYKASYKFSWVVIIWYHIDYMLIFIPECIFSIAPGDPFFITVTHLSQYITMVVLPIQFSSILYLVRQRMQILNSFFASMEKRIGFVSTNVETTSHIIKNSYLGAQEIEYIHDINNKLCLLCCRISQMFGCQILLMSIFIFSTDTIWLYCCYALVKRTMDFAKYFHLYTIIHTCLRNVTSIIIIAHFCDSTLKQVSHTKTITHNLCNKLRQPQIRFKLKLFSLHQMHRNVRFTACGLFATDYTMIQMICGLITIYLILMIQMNLWKY